MKPKEIIRYLVSAIEPRKEVLSIAYCGGQKKGKRIESWVNTEMLAKLIELKINGDLDEIEGEHKFPLKKTNRYEHCDLWWSKHSEEHWLEVKTIVFHRDSNGLRKKYKKRVLKDLDKVHRLKSPYNFHHLLMVFDDENFDTGDWKEDIYSVYKSHDLEKEDNWNLTIDKGHTLHIFLHNYYLNE